MEYLVIWHYVANYGHVCVEAENPEEAKNKVWNGRKDIEYFVVPQNQVKHFPEAGKDD